MERELSDKMKERLSKWLDGLNEEEKLQTDVLNEYFRFRENKPGSDIFLGKLVEEPKSTDEIMDELSSMVQMTKTIVAQYMRIHEFGMKTLADGMVKWAIWRYIDGSSMT